MLEAEEIDLYAIEERASAPTALLLKQLFPFNAFPRPDSAGITRHGIGRPIETRPMSPQVAEVALLADISTTQQALRPRIFELIARHPEFEERLPYLYAIADILGTDKMSSWSRLWHLISIGDMEGVAAELVVANWDTLVGRDETTRKAIFRIINRLQMGVAVQ